MASLTKRLNEIQPCLYAFDDDSSRCFFLDYKMVFLSCNCIFFPIIWSMSFILGGLIFLMNKISHSYWVWEIFLIGHMVFREELHPYFTSLFFYTRWSEFSFSYDINHVNFGGWQV